jgi:hypothetical protein
MNLVSASLSRKCIVCRLKIGYLKLHVLGAEVLPSLKGQGKSDLADGGHCCFGTFSWKGARLTRSTDLESSIWSKVFKNRMFRELPPSTRFRFSLTSLMMGVTISGY